MNDNNSNNNNNNQDNSSQNNDTNNNNNNSTQEKNYSTNENVVNTTQQQQQQQQQNEQQNQNSLSSSSPSHQSSTSSKNKYHTVDPVVENVSEEKKLEYRKFAWKYIQQLGNSLKITKVTVLATALVYYHRFYAQYSYKEFDNLLVATTCLFLSAKVEEKFRKLDNFISHAYYIRTREKINSDNPIFKDYRKKVIQMEGILVQTLDFNFEVDHPHRYLADLLKNVKDDFKVDLTPSQGKEFVRIAGNFVNDSLRTPLCVTYSPKQIACAALSLAFKCHKYQFKEGFSWKKVQVQDDDVNAISNKILDIYEKNQSSTDSMPSPSSSLNRSNDTGHGSSSSSSSSSSNNSSSRNYDGPKLPFSKPDQSKSSSNNNSQKDVVLPFKTKNESPNENDNNNDNKDNNTDQKQNDSSNI